LLGTFFFGIHSTAFYVTSTVAFLPDLSYSFFYLLSVFFFVKYLRVRAVHHDGFVSPFLFNGAFLQEAAITLPL
jgi:hypothetical protein